MKILKSWPFEVADQYEKRWAPLNVWLPRSLIVGFIAGLTSAVVVLFGMHY
jgi:hypothetical protein